MGFFQELKEDLSQAVTELMPNENEETKKEELISEEEINETEILEDTNLADGQGTVSLEDYVDLKDEDDVAKTFDSSDLDEISVLDSLLEEMDTKIEEGQYDNVEELVVDKIVMEPPIDTIQETKKAGNNLYGGDKKMDDHRGKQATDETAVITAGMKILGNISSEGSVDVIGEVEGDIDVLGKLNVTGSIKGNSKATEIYADSAKILGEVNSFGSVKIGPSTVIIGNLIATSAVIAGAIKGDIDVKGPVILDASAIVMGDIKSKSVQINNGAVVEGLCSQCYAEVSPTTFFDDFSK